VRILCRSSDLKVITADEVVRWAREGSHGDEGDALTELDASLVIAVGRNLLPSTVVGTDLNFVVGDRRAVGDGLNPAHS
jgi:hypothetical protein